MTQLHTYALKRNTQLHIALCSALQEIDLGSNGIAEGGSGELAEALINTQSLLGLTLDNNPIGMCV